MKKYTTPELNVRAFDMEAILTDSATTDTGYIAELNGISEGNKARVSFNEKQTVGVSF